MAGAQLGEQAAGVVLAAGVAAAAVIGFYVGMTGMVTLPGDEQEPTFYDLADVVFDVYSEEISL